VGAHVLHFRKPSAPASFHEGTMAATTRLELSAGGYIVVRDKLKVQDKEDIHSYSVDGMATDGRTYRFNVVKHQVATVAARLAEWSLEPAWKPQSPFKDRTAAIRRLDEDQFEPIAEALAAHDKARDEAEADAKNATADGEIDSAATSPSAR
jgi:hypothetical protein